METISTYDQFVAMLMAMYNVRSSARGEVLVQWVMENVPHDLLRDLYDSVVSEENRMPLPATLKIHLNRIQGINHLKKTNYMTDAETLEMINTYFKRKDCQLPDSYCYFCQGRTLGCRVSSAPAF